MDYITKIETILICNNFRPNLVAPYCAIPRDYLSDTPLLRAMGFLVSQHGQLGAIPPPPFLSVSPMKSMRSGGAIPPLKRGISAILARYPLKTRQMGAIPPSAILSRKGIARYGGVSRTGPLSAPMVHLDIYGDVLGVSFHGGLESTEAASVLYLDGACLGHWVYWWKQCLDDPNAFHYALPCLRGQKGVGGEARPAVPLHQT